MIKTRNGSRSALRGELVAVGMKWKSMPLSDLMKCEIEYIDVTRHFHLVVSALANTSRKRMSRESKRRSKGRQTRCTTEWQEGLRSSVRMESQNPRAWDKPPGWHPAIC